MRTEEDTFLALKRLPFRQVLVHCLDGVQLGDDICNKNRLYIEQAGWSVEEFRSKMLSEIIANRLAMDMAIVTDGDWQREYLQTGPI